MTYEAMVEKVARALYLKSMGHQISGTHWPGDDPRSLPYEFQFGKDTLMTIPLDEHDTGEKAIEDLGQLAKTALAALGITPDHEVWIAPVQPTEAMETAVYRYMVDCDDTFKDPTAVRIMNAMRKAHTGREE